jgi:7,8-dihydro-6-hydroxymethylpterin-pyrophosphokinase
MKNYRSKTSIERTKSESITDCESVKEQNFINLMVEIVVSMTMNELNEEINQITDLDN